ncbi:MAG: CHAT domain-containing protein [Chroococcidiopsidaceae cyanobacterium CP_BM_ER_R8_30]|nr:CHAT domain-containing protein [Chroococcidiopsidaceae cyanobacterium CP_BM_ER_R8_30]
MIGENEALAVMRKHGYRGDYKEVVTCAESLSPELRSRPLIVLEQSRAFLRQGRPINAESVIATADLTTATPKERLILAIEAASLQVYRYVAIRQALADAQTAFEKAKNHDIDPVDQAEAERVHIRILLTAAIYYEISRDEGRRTRDRLPILADILEHAGHIDEALAARYNYVERIDDIPARLAALSDFADMALDAGRPDLSGEAHCVRADQLLVAGAPSAVIRDALERARKLYEQAEHEHGLIDVQRITAKLAIERELADADMLHACFDAYQHIDFPRGAISVLLDLSQLAHDRGDLATAAANRQQTIAIAEEVGMGLARDSYQMAQIDLLMRSNQYGAAIELAEAAIDIEPPTFSKASYEQLLATVYSFIANYRAACTHGRRAVELFETLGAIDSASDAVMKLASDLSSGRQEESWNEAQALLKIWIAKDEERGDFAAAVNKREMLAQINIERFYYSPLHQGEFPLLNTAEAEIKAAEELSHHLSERETIRRLGNLHQLRGQIHQGRGDEDSVIQVWREALAIYERASLAMEAANCRHILGAIYLNRANQDLLANFGEAENNLRTALAYYENAGMRGQAADTSFMLARLYTNASARVSPDLGNQMIEAALGHLANGEFNYDIMRREFTAGRTVFDVQGGKRALLRKSERIYELALEIICLYQPNPAEAWNWVQRAKARTLSDVLGIGSVPPARILAELAKHLDSFHLVTQERELVARIDRVPSPERVALRAEIAAFWNQMSQDPHLADYLELRIGAALDTDALKEMLTDTDQRTACVCIDWIGVNDRLFLIALRPGNTPQIIPISLRLSAIRNFVSANLAPESFRSTLRDAPQVLHELNSLVAPIAELSSPDELLILCPSGPLHALPLHALEVNGNPLLVRNPIVYSPSLSVLRYCLARRRTQQGMPSAVLFGDPSGDRSEAADLVAHLAKRFGAEAFTRQSVTRQTFTKAIAGHDIVHFQGHAVHDRNDPLNSYLLLADGKFTAREVFGVADLQAGLVTLAACESAANVIETGDEPLGLIPAFLYAGANAVLATLWKVHRSSAAQTMQLFYDKLADKNSSIDKAEALRQAMLTVRSTPGFDSPYHWAPFILHGDWH